jgi:hypothetical protein
MGSTSIKGPAVSDSVEDHGGTIAPCILRSEPTRNRGLTAIAAGKVR